jgi:hypothetical protein
MRDEGLWRQGFVVIVFKHYFNDVFVESWVVCEVIQDVLHDDLEAGKGNVVIG